MTIRFEGTGGICINFPEGKNVYVHTPDLRISGRLRKVMLQSLGEGFSMEGEVYKNGRSLDVYGGRVVALPITSVEPDDPIILGDTYDPFDDGPNTGSIEIYDPLTREKTISRYRG